MFKIGDLVRTKDVVGVLDGDVRGPGHHTHYNVVQIDKDGLTLETGNGTQSRGWQPEQLEGATLGHYMAQLIAEAKHHLDWEVAKIQELLKRITIDNLINLGVLDQLRDIIEAAIQAGFEMKYQEVSESLFSAEPSAETIKTLHQDNLVAWEQMIDSAPADPWAELAGDAVLTGADLSLNNTDRTMIVVCDGAQFISIHDTEEEAKEALSALVAERQAITIEIPNFQRQCHMLALAPDAVSLGVGPGWEVTLESTAKGFSDFTPPEPQVLDSEIPLTDLARITGKKVDHLNKLIKRGVLPEGNKVGRTRFMPAKQCIEILSQDKEKYAHWAKPAAQAPQANSWDDLK